MDSTRARLHSSYQACLRIAINRRPQDLSVTKQHRNDRCTRWDRCSASAGDWQLITTTSHRSANQRYFMHNSTTVHRMRMQSSALDSSRSQLCNDTSSGVVQHQITKWRRLQKVVSYDVLHHSDLTGDGGHYSCCDDVAPAIQKVYCEICSGGRHLLDAVAAKCRDGQRLV